MRRLALGPRQRRSQRTATAGPKRLRNLQHRALASQTKIRRKRRKRRRRGGSSDRATAYLLPTNHMFPFRFPFDRPALVFTNIFEHFFHDRYTSHLEFILLSMLSHSHHTFFVLCNENDAFC